MSGTFTATNTIRATLSRILYRYDLEHASSCAIPLGVIAEATTTSVRAIGLIARTNLLEDELAHIAERIRPQLESPFQFLKEEFEWSFNNTPPGGALQALASRFSESLFFAPPHAEIVKTAFPNGIVAPIPVLSELRRRRDDEFAGLLAESFPATVSSDEELVPTEDVPLDRAAFVSFPRNAAMSVPSRLLGRRPTEYQIGVTDISRVRPQFEKRL